MLQRQIVVSLYFIIQGSAYAVHIIFYIVKASFVLIAFFVVVRASPSEFVIPLAKYIKTVYHTRVSVGMRFRMLFETEESSVRR